MTILFAIECETLRKMIQSYQPNSDKSESISSTASNSEDKFFKPRLSSKSNILQPYQFEPACHSGNKEQGNTHNPPNEIGVGAFIAE